MQIPLQITFRNFEHSDAVEARIREKAQKLERFAEHITSCRVTLEAPHQHQQKGNLYSVVVDITLPGQEIVANRHSDKHQAHQDIYVAIRDAFNAAQRQVEDYVRKRRGDVKNHDIEPHGMVKELHPEADFGVIQTPDQREIYFHRNSLTNAEFEQLEVGSLVHFNEEMGEKRPQASTVHIEGKHHPR